MNLTVRVAQQEDLAELVEILSDSFYPRQGIMRWLAPLLRLGIYEDLRRRLTPTSSDYIFLVAILSSGKPASAGSQIIGTVEISLRSANAFLLHSSHYPYLSNLAVRSEYRRQGIAQNLLSSSEELLQSQGFQDLYLHVLENNYPARNLYFKAGYRLQQADPLWYSWLFRRPRRLLLHKRITAFLSSLDRG